MSVALLHGSAEAIASVEQFVGEALSHGLFRDERGVIDDPANGQVFARTRLHFDGHLIGGATNTTAAHLERWLHVVDRSLQRGDGLTAGLSSINLSAP